MTICLIGESREDALERAQSLYGHRARDVSFEEWLSRLEAIGVVGSIEEAADRLRAYERAGCDRVMLQHLLHTDLEPVRLIGRELAPALA
jgi:alkanesulfonate monooxygenase SsuD/methylene tetrahydromethanopterin reductase-like flavin-dependent oxidoreductase (luciferase family)